MADDSEYKELEAEFKAYFASEPVDDDVDDADHDNSFVPGDTNISQAFARLLCSSNVRPPYSLEQPMAPFLDMGKVESVKDNCLNIYNEEKIKIKSILSNLGDQICISAEMLRSSVGTEYVCLKAHFIDENWKLKEWVLRYHALPEIVFVEGIQKGIAAWGIENKVSTITIKAPNYLDFIDEMADTVKDQIIKKKTLPLGGRLFHVYCCAELLNQMVQVAFKEVSGTINKIKTLISWGGAESMWHLTSSRLKMALEMQSEGEFDSGESSVFYEVPSAEEWKKVEGVCKVVDLIETVAKLLFLKKKPTACDFLGNLIELKANLNSDTVKSDDFRKGLVEKMVKKLDNYLKKMFLILGIATVLDPRCKMHYINFVCLKIEAGNCDIQVSSVLEGIRSLYNEYYCSISTLNRKRKSTEEVEEGGDVNNCSSEKTDLDLYLEDPLLSWSQNFDVLNWWKESNLKYPVVARMARDFLSIPWLVISSYDGYYTEERMVDMYMVSKGQNFTNALMCTRSWKS